MRTFTLRLFTFFVAFNALSFAVAPALSRYHGNNKVYEALEAVSSYTETKKLILGDSVGAQVYPTSESKKSEVICATSNRAIGMVGQLILLQDFLASRKSTKQLEVHIIMHPGSFGARLDEKFTFNYYLQPFWRRLLQLSTPREISPFIKPTALLAALKYIPATRIMPYDVFTGNERFPPMRSNPEIMDYTFWALTQIDSIASTGVDIQFHCAPLQSNWRDSSFVNLDENLRPFENLAFHYSENQRSYLRPQFFKEGTHLNSAGLEKLGDDPFQLLD